VKQTDPNGYIHIVSKDKDFDALIGHHKQNGGLAARHSSFGEIPVLMNQAERVTCLSGYFKSNSASRPKSRRSLESHIQALFGKSLSSADVEATIQGLVASKVITLSESGAVGYAPPPAPTESAKPIKKAGQDALQIALSELATQALTHLRLQASNRPKTKDALASYLQCALGHKHPPPMIFSAIKNLRQAGHLSFVKKAVTYHL
jgi:hypothetical protein